MIQKTVEGAATGPFAVDLACVPDGQQIVIEWTLHFDATGAPTTAEPLPTSWEIVDGAWVLDATTAGPGECTATETDADGATSTSWTCDFVDESSPPAAGGCDADSGSGTGPVGWSHAATTTPGVDQTVTVHFTNTVETPTTTTTTTIAAAPAAIVAAPTFTG